MPMARRHPLDPKDERPPPPRLALNIGEFCKAHAISVDFYFKLKRQGEGPVEMKVGSRTLISLEAAAAWRRAREAASVAAAKVEAEA